MRVLRRSRMIHFSHQVECDSERFGDALGRLNALCNNLVVAKESFDEAQRDLM